MHLVQILLPLYHNDGTRVPNKHFKQIAQELTDRFGGLTAYNRSPAEGRWTKGKKQQRDVIVVFEVMTNRLDAKWWRLYKKNLEAKLCQDTVVVRSQVTRTH